MILEDLIKIYDFEKYAAQIFLNLSYKIAYIRSMSEPLIMVTDERKIFIISIRTNYVSTT